MYAQPEAAEHPEPVQVLIGGWKFGWLNTLYMFAPTVSVIRSLILKFLFTVKSESKNPGPRYWLRFWFGKVGRPVAPANSAELKHWLNPFEQFCCAGPSTCVGAVAPGPAFAIATVPSVTVKGRPLRTMKFSDTIQPPAMAFRIGFPK